LDNLHFSDVVARISYENGLLQLDELRGAMPYANNQAGTFAGKAQYQYLPQGDLTADLSVKSLALGELSTLAARLGGHVAGVVSGNVRARIAQGKFQDLNAWDVTGDVTSPHVS